MNWKISLGQFAATIVAVLLFIHLFYSGRLAEIQLQQKNISSHLHYLEGYVGKLEKQINETSEISGSEKPDIVASFPLTERLTDQKIDELEQRLLGLEEAIRDRLERDTSTTVESGSVSLLSPPPASAAPGDWLASLPLSKQALVEDVYREQMKFIQDEVSNVTGEYPPDPEEMHRIFMENREQLESKLKQILNDEEFQIFLDTARGPLSSP